MMPALRSLLFLLLMAVGLLGPGWLLGRVLRTPAGFLGAFLGSAALLLNLLLTLDAFDVSFTDTHLAAGLGIVCAVLTVIAKLRATPALASTAVTSPAFRWQRHYWLLLPVTLGLGAVVVRATLDPLSGFDTYFRWDFLARQMLHEGNLHFYPAVSDEDFLRYGWCDGIAPLVSSLYFWSYLSLGRIAAWASAPVVVAQAALLFGVVWQLAARRGGFAAGTAATAVLATSSIALWGVAMGQETGLTALCLAAMFWFIDRHVDEPGARWLVWAGVAAGTGSLAREYGLAFLALGAFALAWRRTPRHGWLEFALAAALVALPWYLRNWLKTANPLWCQPLGGLFPTNPVQADYFRALVEINGVGGSAAPLLLLKSLVCLAGVPLVLGFAGAFARRREDAPWFVALAAVVTLWLLSIGQTSGGYVYSLRVLTPVLALAAALAGPIVARWVAGRHGWWLAILLTLAAVDASVRSLYLPINPQIAWWCSAPSGWREFGLVAARWRADPNWAAIADAAGSRRIVVSDPSYYARLTDLGAKPLPLFSPAVRFLFDPSTTLATGAARLRDGGARFILMTLNNDVLDRQFSGYPFFRALLASPPTATTQLCIIYDLFSPTLRVATEPAPQSRAP